MTGAGAALVEAALGQLLGLVEDADRPRVAELQRRLTAGTLRVLVAGEAKRGKSTLVNALLGEPVLPTGVLPLTAVATTVGYGETAEVLVRFHDSRVEQHPPTRLLAGGLELVDTPGTGSVHAHSVGVGHGTSSAS